MNSWFHAKSAARKFGGSPDDYIAIEEWIDGSKEWLGDVRHRAVRHHVQGVWMAQEQFGRVIKVGDRGIEVPVRLVAEQHIIEDLGWLPSITDYLKNLPIEPWMSGSRRREMNMGALLGMVGRDDEGSPV